MTSFISSVSAISHTGTGTLGLGIISMPLLTWVMSDLSILFCDFKLGNSISRRKKREVFTYLEVMRMPKLPLLYIKLLIQSRRYHILHSDQPCGVGWSIIDQTLSHLLMYISHISITRVILKHRDEKLGDGHQNWDVYNNGLLPPNEMDLKHRRETRLNGRR